MLAAGQLSVLASPICFEQSQKLCNNHVVRSTVGNNVRKQRSNGPGAGCLACARRNMCAVRRVQDPLLAEEGSQWISPRHVPPSTVDPGCLFPSFWPPWALVALARKCTLYISTDCIARPIFPTTLSLTVSFSSLLVLPPLQPSLLPFTTVSVSISLFLVPHSFIPVSVCICECTGQRVLHDSCKPRALHPSVLFLFPN